MPGAGSKTGGYLEYPKLCLKLYRKLSIHLTHLPDALSRPGENEAVCRANQATPGLIHIISKMKPGSFFTLGNGIPLR